jgi:hypothetical protein
MIAAIITPRIAAMIGPDRLSMITDPKAVTRARHSVLLTGS